MFDVDDNELEALKPCSVRGQSLRDPNLLSLDTCIAQDLAIGLSTECKVNSPSSLRERPRHATKEHLHRIRCSFAAEPPLDFLLPATVALDLSKPGSSRRAGH